MTRLVVLSVLALTACGPDTAAWSGTYTGSGTYTAGRPPVVLMGTLEISGAGQFTFTGKADGPTFTGVLQAESVTDTTATFKLPATGTATASPSDGCTRQVTVTMASASRDGANVEGSFNGNLRSECSGAGTSNETFLISFGGTKR